MSEPSSTDLRQLAAFLAVRRHASFTLAADELGVPQPAVSRLMSRLEHRIGIVLFERSSRRVQLTAAGEALSGEAERAVDAVARFDARVRELHTGAGVLRVGTTEGAAATVQGILKRFTALWPITEVRLERQRTPEKLTRLLQGSLDVAFVRNPPPTAGLRFAEVASEPLLAVVATGHPLAGHGAVSLAQLAGYPLMVTPEDINPGVHHAVMAAVRRPGNALVLGAPLRNEADGLAQVAVSRAWTLLSASSLRGHHDEVVGLELVEDDLRASVVLAWRPTGMARAARAFVELVCPDHAA